MPVVVTGLKEAQKAMRSLQPDLEKNLKAEIKAFLLPVVKKSRGYVPSSISGLSHWKAYAGNFPQYNAAAIKRGIKSQQFPTRHRNSGFLSLVRIVNLTRAGSIFEKAGRLTGTDGQAWVGRKDFNNHKVSHSINPNAGAHFVQSIQSAGNFAGSGARRGRVIYRAYDEDQGKSLGHVLTALNKTAAQTKKYVAAAKAFRSVQ
jgi:hypothetical protein